MLICLTAASAIICVMGLIEFLTEKKALCGNTGQESV